MLDGLLCRGLKGGLVFFFSSVVNVDMNICVPVTKNIGASFINQTVASLQVFLNFTHFFF